MPDLKQWALNCLNFWYLAKDKNLQWQQTHQDQEQLLKQSKAFAQKNLEAQLKTRSVQLEHEIALLRETHHAQLTMHKTKCKQDINDYKQYLDALDQLKAAIQNSYTHLPSAVAFTIHHHAKYLLNAMWEAKSNDEKMHREIQLIRFMSTVHEDARLYLEGATEQQLPENTLNMIQQK